MISRKLRKREAAGTPIRVGWGDAGRMITGAICQTAQMKGMSNVVIYDVQPEASVRAYGINGFWGALACAALLASTDFTMCRTVCLCDL